MTTELLNAKPNYDLALEFAQRQYEWVDFVDCDNDYIDDVDFGENHSFSFGYAEYSRWQCEREAAWCLLLKPVEVNAEGIVSKYEFVNCEQVL